MRFIKKNVNIRITLTLSMEIINTKKLLFADILNLTIKNNIDDVVISLMWFNRTDNVTEKIRYLEHSIDLLDEIKDNLNLVRP